MSLARILKWQLRRLPIIGPIAAQRDRLHELESERDFVEREKKRLRDLHEAAELERKQVKTWVVPGHYYSPIPSLTEIRKRAEYIFAYPERVPGINLRDAEQLELLHALKPYYGEIPFPAEASKEFRYFYQNINFSFSDASLFYCLIRHIRPKRIIEAGSGYSSCVTIDTNERHFENRIRCTFIEPYPQLLFDLLHDGDRDRIEVLPRTLQEVPIETFMQLEDNDILFIDSTHVSKTGSDVNFILFNILPVLKRGVWIHFHDIFFPFEYPAWWVYQGRAWNEIYILRAFLQDNPSYRIELFTSQIIERHRAFFEQSMPRILANEPGSIWLRKTAEPSPVDLESLLTAPRFRPTRRINLPQPDVPNQIVRGWFDSEGQHRWMAREAEIRIGGPRHAGEKLHLVGYTQAETPVTLTLLANNHPLGSVAFASSQLTQHELALPAEMVGLPDITLVLRADSTFRAPGDPRELSVAFGTIEIR